MIWCYLYVMWICFFAKSIPFACFIIFHWNLFLNIFRKHLYWQWLQGCCLTFFFFLLSYTLLCDPNLNRCDTKVFQFFSVLQTNVITFRANTIWILHFHRYGMCFFSSFHCRRGGGKCYVSFENPITKRATFQHKFHEIFHSLPSVLQFFSSPSKLQDKKKIA